MFARTNRSENPIVKSRRDAHARDERQLFFRNGSRNFFHNKPQGKVGNNKSFWGKMESMFDLDREQIFVRIVAILGVSSSQPCFIAKSSARPLSRLDLRLYWVFTFAHNKRKNPVTKKIAWSIADEKVEKCLPSFSPNRNTFNGKLFHRLVHNGLECGKSERRERALFSSLFGQLLLDPIVYWHLCFLSSDHFPLFQIVVPLHQTSTISYAFLWKLKG